MTSRQASSTSIHFIAISNPASTPAAHHILARRNARKSFSYTPVAMLCLRCSRALASGRLASPTTPTTARISAQRLRHLQAPPAAHSSFSTAPPSLRPRAQQTKPPTQTAALPPSFRSHYSSVAPEPAAEPQSSSTTTTPEKPDYLDTAETEIWERLTKEFSPAELVVQDISGGCGSMYGIEISSEKFRGANMLKQQRMVNAALGDLMKTWHGVQLKTRVP